MRIIDNYQHDSSAYTPDELFKNYYSYVVKIAKSIKRKLPSSVELSDLIQSGYIGLLEANKSYDKKFEVAFQTYAAYRVRGAILDFLRENSWSDKRSLKYLKEINDSNEELEKKLQRTPTVSELANHLGISADEYQKRANVAMISLYLSTEPDSIELLQDDNALSPESIAEFDSLNTKVKSVISTLNQRDQTILSLYYIEELSLHDIGYVLGLTEARICQLHAQLLSKIRSRIQS